MGFGQLDVQIRALLPQFVEGGLMWLAEIEKQRRSSFAAQFDGLHLEGAAVARWGEAEVEMMNANESFGLGSPGKRVRAVHGYLEVRRLRG